MSVGNSRGGQAMNDVYAAFEGGIVHRVRIPISHGRWSLMNRAITMTTAYISATISTNPSMDGGTTKRRGISSRRGTQAKTVDSVRTPRARVREAIKALPHASNAV